MLGPNEGWVEIFKSHIAPENEIRQVSSSSNWVDAFWVTQLGKQTHDELCAQNGKYLLRIRLGHKLLCLILE